MLLSDLIKKEKIPFSQRCQASAITFFGSIFAGLALIFVAPFSAFRVLFTKERTVPDLTKIKFCSGKQIPSEGLNNVGPQEAVEETKQGFYDLFDIREEWKKAHDEEFGEDEDENAP